MVRDRLIFTIFYNLKEYLLFAETLAYEAGRMMMDAILKPKDIASKTCHQDLVTESDKAIEELIKNKISEKYPHHQYT